MAFQEEKENTMC